MTADERPRLGAEQGQWLAQLHERHFETMVRMAARELPPPCRANAEDVVQTVFAEAALAAVRRPDERIGVGWLIRRLQSRIIDYHRHTARHQRLLAAAATVEPQSSAEEIVVDRSAVDSLLAAIPDPADQLTLAFRLYGYRESEIAALMSLNVEGRQVRDRMQRVRRLAGAWRATDWNARHAQGTYASPPPRTEARLPDN